MDDTSGSSSAVMVNPDRIAVLQEEYLIPMKEDLSDWLKVILDLDDLDAYNFMSKLDNGVIVCKLAKLIEERCSLDDVDFLANHVTSKPLEKLGRRSSYNCGGGNGHLTNGSGCSSPSAAVNGIGISARKMKCWENAKSESFYARDNVSNFIEWCRKLNVRECVLFESEDLVLHNNPRNVVLCLLEVARIACKKFMFSPAPGLVLFEQEIDAEEKAELEREMVRRRKRQQQSMNDKSNGRCNSVNNNSSSNNINNTNNLKEVNNHLINLSINNNHHHDNINNNNNNIIKEESIDTNGNFEMKSSPERPESSAENVVLSDSGSTNAGDDGVDGWSSVSQDNLGRASSVTSISSTSVESAETSSQTQFDQDSDKVVSQLDQKVMLIAKSYYGKKAKHGIQRLAEGKYRIAGKIVFVRLLKDRHVMVRVGGGWDTLQHFLERHGTDSDPVKEISPSDLLPMDTRPSESMSRRRNSQSSQQSVPSTPVLRRCLSSTPVSRSSFSSPEPWMSGSSGSSSYTSTGPQNGHRPLARRSSACTTTPGSLEKVGLPLVNSNRRRSLVNEGTKSTIKPNRSMLSLNLTKSPSTSSHLNSSFSARNNSSSSLNLNAITNNSNNKTSRYPNYLQSSQHITRRSATSPASTPTNKSASSTNKSTTSSPTTPTTAPTTPTAAASPAPLRRATLKAF